MVNTKKFILAKRFQGEPKETDFRLVEEQLPALKDGEILTEAVWLSIDPYMRVFCDSPGDTMLGCQVAKIIQSRNQDFPVGKYIVSYLGWQTHAVHDPTVPQVPGFPLTYLLPDFGDLGAVGMPGNTAYFGFLELCQPKAGEVVVVSGAAGAVGSLVGQIARSIGCTVIGFAGSDDKVRWLKDDLGFNFAFNYKKTDVDTALKEVAPGGVDCYFDTVGGTMSSIVLSHMKSRGRITVVGNSSSYNAEKPLASVIQSYIVFKELKMQGFSVFSCVDRWMEGIHHMLDLVKKKQIVYRETVTEGFENMPRAFISHLRGDTTGKPVIKSVSH